MTFKKTFINLAPNSSLNMPDKRVLVYDDEEEICFICKFILSRQYDVETLPSCINLFEDIERIKPHLILIDLMMPDMDGAHAITAILENENTKHIPTILFSAAPAVEQISKIIRASAFIRKPFNIDHLRETVGNLIDATSN